MRKLCLLFCFIFIFELKRINSEPLRKYSHIGPFPRYPANVPTPQSNFNENENYNPDYDYLNNVSLGRLLQDDNSLIQQTDQLSSQVKTQIASKLINLANRLQHAAGILLDGTFRRRSHRPNPHRNNYKPRYQPVPTSPRPIDDNLGLPSRTGPNSNDKRNPEQSSPKPTIETTSDNPKSTSKPTDLPDSSSPKPLLSEDSAARLLDGLNLPRNFGPDIGDRKDEENRDDKKKRDIDEIRDALRRSKRDVDVTVEHPLFKSVTKRQLLDVSSEVRSGYDSVIKLLKNYLDDPPVTSRQVLKRSTQRAGELLDNIENAKKIFVTIEDYVSQQYLENSLENRNQTELLSYFDKIIRVEKNRISQALNEYTTQLATNYTDFKPKRPIDSTESDVNDPHVPSSSLEREYQNDDDLNSYVNERRRAIEREIERESVRSSHATNYNNEIAREEKLSRSERPIKPTIVVRRVYIPPKSKSRSTRRHPAASDRVRPPYEASISHKEPIENNNDESGYEMIEP